MKIMKSAVMATVLAATALGATATTASAKKFRPFGNSNTGNFVAGAIVGATVVSVANHESCKKWKHRYQRTGNPYYLDRYYDCKN